MSDNEERVAFDVKAQLEEMLSDMPIGDVADQILKERAEAQKIRQLADERFTALDREKAKVARLEGELKASQAEIRIYSNDRDSLRRQLDVAQGAAMEIRGRLLEMRDNQMVRRGDVRAPEFPSPYDDPNQVPF